MADQMPGDENSQQPADGSTDWGPGGSSSSAWGDNETYGVREFANKMVELLHFYRRHGAVIDLFLPASIVTALHLIDDALVGFQSLNPEGPA